jgi:predicted dehydrogenase
MLEERDIDMVDIATCTLDHVKPAIMALKKGFWTLLETPMALTPDEAQLLRGQAMKSKNRLMMLQRGIYAPDFLLARQAMSDGRLGQIHQVRIRREDYIRRDDWQAVKRLGGGAAYYAMTDLVIQTLRLLPSPPVQMFSELKRIASLGDAEDYVHINLKTRDAVSADVEFNGGVLPGERSPSFEILGERGVFRVESGASSGIMRVIDPDFKFPRRRSSVRTPEIKDMHEDFPVVDIEYSLPKGTMYGASAFWKHVYDTVRTAAPFPIRLEESIEAVKFSHLMKKTSPFGK